MTDEVLHMKELGTLGEEEQHDGQIREKIEVKKATKIN
jgi:hypothetical protein